MPKTKGEKVRRAPLKLSDDRNGSTFVKGLREIQVMVIRIVVMMTDDDASDVDDAPGDDGRRGLPGADNRPREPAPVSYTHLTLPTKA